MEAVKTININEIPIDLKVLYHRMRQLEEKIESIANQSPTLKVRTQQGTKLIPQEEIIRCHASNNYTIIIHKDGSKTCVSKTLKIIQEQLCQNRFIRVHASHLVAAHEVRMILNKNPRSIMLSNGDQIPVSRSYQSDVEAVFA